MTITAKLIDRSLVAILDIEGWSKEAPRDQAQLVEAFVNQLGHFLATIQEFEPDAFSTGDGAIISIGRAVPLDEKATEQFIKALLDFTRSLLSDGLFVRVAINTGQLDLMVSIPEGNALRGDIVQVGDTINIAARIMNYCEPREVMLSAETVSWLRLCGLEDCIPVLRNYPLVTKHQVSLDTYSYDPIDEDKGVFYSPRSPTHVYKRYSGFPSIKSETLRSFAPSGLHRELERVVANAYDSMQAVNETRTFLSWRNVLKVLVQLNYDPTDDVLILSRNERPIGFWTQERREEYLAYLEANAVRNGGYINQTRVVVHKPISRLVGAEHLMPDVQLYDRLLAIHNTDSYYSVPSTIFLANYDRLSELTFGFTLSTKHRFVVIPIPSPEELDADAVNPKNLRYLLRSYAEYRTADGPFRAVISADEQFVSELEREMRALIVDHAEKIK